MACPARVGGWGWVGGWGKEERVEWEGVCVCGREGARRDAPARPPGRGARCCSGLHRECRIERRERREESKAHLQRLEQLLIWGGGCRRANLVASPPHQNLRTGRACVLAWVCRASWVCRA